MMQLYTRARAILNVKAVPRQLDNEEVNAAEAAAVMGAWRARRL
jgi:hypothetical protein